MRKYKIVEDVQLQESYLVKKFICYFSISSVLFQFILWLFNLSIIEDVVDLVVLLF